MAYVKLKCCDRITSLDVERREDGAFAVIAEDRWAVVKGMKYCPFCGAPLAEYVEP